jgi:hypothetical protein
MTQKTVVELGYATYVVSEDTAYLGACIMELVEAINTLRRNLPC